VSSTRSDRLGVIVSTDPATPGIYLGRLIKSSCVPESPSRSTPTSEGKNIRKHAAQLEVDNDTQGTDVDRAKRSGLFSLPAMSWRPKRTSELNYLQRFWAKPSRCC